MPKVTKPLKKAPVEKKKKLAKKTDTKKTDTGKKRGRPKKQKLYRYQAMMCPKKCIVTAFVPLYEAYCEHRYLAKEMI